MGLNSTLQGDGWHVDPITSPPVLANIDSVTGGSVFSLSGRDVAVGVIVVSPSGDTTGATDTARINAALQLGSTDNGIVELTAGSFYLSSAILPPSGSTLRGQGVSSKVYATAAMVNDNTSNTGTNCIYITGVTDVSISGLFIDGSRTLATTGDDGQSGLDSGRNAIRGYAAQRVSVTGCEIKGAVFHGVFVDEDSAEWTITGNRIHDNGFRACHIHAQASDANKECSDSIVSQNIVYQNGASACALQAGSLAGLYCCFDNTRGIVISNNVIFDEDGYGIELRGSNDAVITRTGTTTSASAVITGLSSTTDLRVGGYVEGSGILQDSKIISVDSASQVTLSKAASASASPSLTFYPRAGEKSVVSANVVRNCSNVSIALSDYARDIVIANNVVAGGGSRAISVDAAAGKRCRNITVVGNSISDHGSASTGYGIYIDEVYGFSVVGNTVFGCGKEAVSVTTSDNGVVASNTINTADSYGIRVGATGVIISGNNVTSRASVTIDVMATATNCVVCENFATRTGGGAAIVNAGTGTQMGSNRLGSGNTLTAGSATGLPANISVASGAATATLTNAPVAGNPAEWISVVGPSGTARSFPAW